MSTDIIEGNKLIAIFMDGKIAMNINGEDYYEFKGPAVFRIKSCNYNSSWDWLMPVVEKIEKIGYTSRIIYHVEDNGYLCDFYDIENSEGSCASNYESKIKATYLAVVDFITHYNTL